MLVYGNHFVGKRNVYGLSSRDWVNYDYYYALLDPDTNEPWHTPPNYANQYTATAKKIDGVYSSSDFYFGAIYTDKNLLVDIRHDNAVNAERMFRANDVAYIPPNSFNNVVYAQEMFGGDYSNDALTAIPSGSFNNVIDGHEMFRNRTNIEYLGPSSFAKLEDAEYMFLRCYALTGIPSNMFNNVIKANYMFSIPRNFDIPSGYSHLTYLGDNIFNRVQDARGLFGNCSGIKKLPNNSFSSVISANSMFNGCKALTSELIPFITSHPLMTSHSGCFKYCSAARDYNQATALYPDWF